MDRSPRQVERPPRVAPHNSIVRMKFENQETQVSRSTYTHAGWNFKKLESTFEGACEGDINNPEDYSVIIGTDLIDYVIDTTPNKQGKFTPGKHIPILSPEIGFDDTVDYAFLGAWNFKKEIKAKEKNFISRGGKFIIHVPKVKII